MLYRTCTLTQQQSEFASGVEELAKAKLEKPKRLGELAQRWALGPGGAEPTHTRG